MGDAFSLLVVFCSVVTLSVSILSAGGFASASAIFVRQDPSEDCSFGCYPRARFGNTSIEHQLCDDASVVSGITSCLDSNCVGDALVTQHNKLQSTCNSVGVTVTFAAPTATVSETPPTSVTTTPNSSTNPSILTTAASSPPASSPTTPTNTSPAATSTSKTATTPSNSSKSSSSSSSTDPSITPVPSPASQNSIAPIIGGVVGGIAVLIVVLIILYRYRHRLWPSQKKPLGNKPIIQQKSHSDNKLGTEGSGEGPYPSVENSELGIVGSPPPLGGRSGVSSGPPPGGEWDRPRAAEASDPQVQQGNDEDRILPSPDSNRDPRPETMLTPLGELIRQRVFNADSRLPPYERDGPLLPA